ncbi:unnamed protein product [Phytophthora lilii]|uniref:Unnamed protein product n=1 Tax=Phytophthora lilii TaxID=2077276 RepID=A0A9W6XLM6_9STRA|nr:unnamed protein product [Phytophthora lilii]
MSPQLSTPAIVEVVHTPEPSAIKPVESSNVKVSKVPNGDESIVAPVTADSVVYKEDQILDSELNNSIDEDDVIPTKIDLTPFDLHTTPRDDWMWMDDEDEDEDEFFFENYIEADTSLQYDVKENSLDVTAVIGAFDEYINSNGLDIANSAKTDRRAYFDGQMMTNIPIVIDELNVAQYCVANELYDQRLYKLCCMIKRSWFRNNNNTWNLAGALYRKQHVDLGLMRKTYLCILPTMTDRLIKPLR